MFLSVFTLLNAINIGLDVNNFDIDSALRKTKQEEIVLRFADYPVSSLQSLSKEERVKYEEAKAKKAQIEGDEKALKDEGTLFAIINIIAFCPVIVAALFLIQYFCTLDH